MTTDKLEQVTAELYVTRDALVVECITSSNLRRELSEARRANTELQKSEAESRRLFYEEQDKRQCAELRNEELMTTLKGIAERSRTAIELATHK